MVVSVCAFLRIFRIQEFCNLFHGLAFAPNCCDKSERTKEPSWVSLAQCSLNILNKKFRTMRRKNTGQKNANKETTLSVSCSIVGTLYVQNSYSLMLQPEEPSLVCVFSSVCVPFRWSALVGGVEHRGFVWKHAELFFSFCLCSVQREQRKLKNTNAASVCLCFRVFCGDTLWPENMK